MIGEYKSERLDEFARGDKSAANVFISEGGNVSSDKMI